MHPSVDELLNETSSSNSDNYNQYKPRLGSIQNEDDKIRRMLLLEEK
jgi:hypothetical protein